MHNNLAKLTNKSLDTFNFLTHNISKIITNIDLNKAHGHDMLSIRMIKLCGNSICKPLSIIFNDCLKEEKFTSDWKRADFVPVRNKGDKQCLKNCPISLLPIRSKIFERVFYNELFTFLTDSNLISPNQSGYSPGDSCVTQLIATIHQIYKLFDDGIEVRGIFLDIPKAFVKVWHEGLFLIL